MRDDVGMSINELGQPVGPAVAGWTPRPRPEAAVLKGRYCRLERLDARQHAEQLFDADQLDGRGESWTYLPYGPFAAFADYRRWVEKVCEDPELVFYTIVSTDPAAAGPEHSAVGVLSLLRMQPETGVMEVGHVHYSPRLQRTRAATEAQYLLASHIFDDLGYRRYEWKCDALNAASRAAAQRLGFSYDGTFRQDKVVKGRNRDTAWYSMVDSEWPATKIRLTSWLSPGNFDVHGRQLTSLDTATTHDPVRAGSAG